MCPLILIFLQPYTQSISSVYHPCSSLSKWSIDYAYACGQGFGYLHFQFSSIRCHQGLSVFTALRSEIDIKCVDTDGPAHPDTAALRTALRYIELHGDFCKQVRFEKGLVSHTYCQQY